MDLQMSDSVMAWGKLVALGRQWHRTKCQAVGGRVFRMSSPSWLEVVAVTLLDVEQSQCHSSHGELHVVSPQKGHEEKPVPWCFLLERVMKCLVSSVRSLKRVLGLSCHLWSTWVSFKVNGRQPLGKGPVWK